MAMMSAWMRLLALVAFCWAAGACNTLVRQQTVTSVGREMVLPQEAERHQMERKQVFFAPTPILDAMPVFPQGRAGEFDEEVVICVEITVSEEGDVVFTRELQLDSECAIADGSASRAFFPVVNEAVTRWSFFAAGVCSYALAEEECDGTDVPLEPVAVNLSYKFRFRQGQVIGEHSRQDGRR